MPFQVFRDPYELYTKNGRHYYTLLKKPYNGPMQIHCFRLLLKQCGFFYVPQKSEQWKNCETGPTVFRPYPRRLERLTILDVRTKAEYSTQ